MKFVRLTIFVLGMLSALAAGAMPVKPVFPPLEPLKAGALLHPADHSEAFTYDLNANVLTIERKGRDDAGRYRVVDDVEMEYVGNRLSVLRDCAADALLEGSMDMPQGVYSGYDIRYDAAGRLTRDVSRGIANINYSVTGMPWVVGTMSGDCAEYGYTSSGVKLWERIYNGSRTTRREYVGPCEYVDGRLARVNVPQGYIDSLGVLHAYIRDIQGNVAGVYAAKAGKKSLEQLNDYYAYGGLTADSRGQDRNRYKHTGKELVTDLGLNSYDFTARWQYPMAGRFDVPDDKASEYNWLSPYTFCGGDPVNLSDPTGKILEVVSTEGFYYWKEVNGVWGLCDANGVLYSGENEFLEQITDALNTIMTGDGGREFITGIANDPNRTASVSLTIKGSQRDDDSVVWNATGVRKSRDGDTKESVPTFDGEDTSPVATLAHELGHVRYGWDKRPDGVWLRKGGLNGHGKDVSVSELYTTHIENVIRKEQGLPLRSHYFMVTSGVRVGDDDQIIDRNGTSRFVDINGKIYDKRLPKGVTPYKYD